MMHFPASVRVYLCLSPCDMRKSFDGLHALVSGAMQLDAFGGHLFVFSNRRRDPRRKTMAILRSFVSTRELVKIDPFAWFQDVLSRIGEHSIKALDELLPHRWTPSRDS
jgi:hypothetical protein